MTILILGCTGMLGHKLAQVLSSKNCYNVIGTCRGLYEYNLHPTRPVSNFKVIENLDCGRLEDVAMVLGKTNPDLIINAVGLTLRHIDDSKKDEVWRINAALPKFLSHFVNQAKKKLIHISTDCVFDGAIGSYKESDWPTAYDVYGLSKLCGEIAGSGVLTIRTSIVGRELRGHTELIEWFMSQKGKEVNGYSGVVYSGLTTNFLSEEIHRILQEYPNLEGLFHVSSEPITKFNLLQMINQKFDLKIKLLNDASKVSDKSLNCLKYQESTGFKVPNWESMIFELGKENHLYKG